jgi:DNA-binding transcriptional ArsR family regulator
MLETFKALADPCRLRLTAVLLSGEFTVQELTRIMGMGQSRVSRHLRILRLHPSGLRAGDGRAARPGP